MGWLFLRSIGVLAAWAHAELFGHKKLRTKVLVFVFGLRKVALGHVDLADARSGGTWRIKEAPASNGNSGIAARGRRPPFLWRLFRYTIPAGTLHAYSVNGRGCFTRHITAPIPTGIFNFSRTEK